MEDRAKERREKREVLKRNFEEKKAKEQEVKAKKEADKELEF